MDNYQQYIYLSRYARWRPEEGRREVWEETVLRYFNYFFERLKPTEAMIQTLNEAANMVLDLQLMPSMRCLMTAGKALEKDNVAGYNCSFITIDDPRAFDEILYILMCGSGVGFSVESKFTNRLPEIQGKIYPTDTTLIVYDSRIGWATSLRELIYMLYAGKEPKWDLSRLRPAGARLKTFGGRSAGPEPLNELFKYIVATFKKAAGRRLSSLECHDIVCKVASAVVAGGVRRSALMSLSDLDNREMQGAKAGNWWESNAQRALANNSAVYTGRPSMGVFMQEWQSLYTSKSGERGIFNRDGARHQASRNLRRDGGFDFGTNPCSEIILRPQEFCNLTEVVVRPDDDYISLKKKVELATVLGTIQSTLTDFQYIRPQWKSNCDDERLLGVSLTGIYDNPEMWSKTPTLKVMLDALRNDAVKINEIWAKQLSIPKSAAITCVKPSGTVSQLVDSASGIHPRYSPYYLRRVRADVKDPLTQMMIEFGFPHEVDETNTNNVVFAFPRKSPESAVVRKDVSAIDQLKLWLLYSRHWTEHKPSITVYVDEAEWLDVGAFVYKNFDDMSGVAFLPKADSDHIYKQAPYEELDEAKYTAALAAMPEDPKWDSLVKFEQDDEHIAREGEIACSAGVCEL